MMACLPPTSVTIQNGKARAIMANISAVRNKAPDINVSFSILYVSQVCSTCNLLKSVSGTLHEDLLLCRLCCEMLLTVKSNVALLEVSLDRFQISKNTITRATSDGKIIELYQQKIITNAVARVLHVQNFGPVCFGRSIGSLRSSKSGNMVPCCVSFSRLIVVKIPQALFQLVPFCFGRKYVL